MRILLAVNVALATFGIAFILTGRAGRQRAERLAYFEAMERLAAEFQQIQIAIGTAMLPAARKMVEAARQFNEAWNRIHNRDDDAP